MRTLYKIPIVHNTMNVQYYDIFLNCTSDAVSEVQVSVYTHYQGEDAFGIQGILTESKSVIQLPFSGFIRCTIPDAARLAENSGLCLAVSCEETVQCFVGDVLLNSDCGKPQVLYLNREQKVSPAFDVQQVSLVQTEVSEKNNLLSFAVESAGEDDYYLVYNSAAEMEMFDETACRLFVPKTNYCMGEPITFTYQNVYLKYDADLYMVDVLLYLEGDQPGITPSRDYVTLLYQAQNRGLNGVLSSPNDGARGYYNRIPGNYTLHIMQKYEDLCPYQSFTVSETHQKDELKAPLPGTLYFIKANRMPAYVEMEANNPKHITVMRFTSHSPMTEVLEQALYRMYDVSHCVGLLKRYANVPERLLHSMISQVLQTAYTARFCELEELSGQKVAHSLPDRIAAFIHQNVENNITMQMLMDTFHVSESHLSHSFKKSKGISVSKYIYNAKVNRAKQWLAENELTVTEIAKMLNYSDIHAFSHSFKMLAGMSPLEYRKLHHKIG